MYTAVRGVQRPANMNITRNPIIACFPKMQLSYIIILYFKGEAQCTKGTSTRTIDSTCRWEYIEHPIKTSPDQRKVRAMGLTAQIHKSHHRLHYAPIHSRLYNGYRGVGDFFPRRSAVVRASCPIGHLELIPCW